MTRIQLEFDAYLRERYRGTTATERKDHGVSYLSNGRVSVSLSVLIDCAFGYDLVLCCRPYTWDTYATMWRYTTRGIAHACVLHGRARSLIREHCVACRNVTAEPVSDAPSLPDDARWADFDTAPLSDAEQDLLQLAAQTADVWEGANPDASKGATAMASRAIHCMVDGPAIRRLNRAPWIATGEQAARECEALMACDELLSQCLRRVAGLGESEARNWLWPRRDDTHEDLSELLN